MSIISNPLAFKLYEIGKSIGDFRIVRCGLNHEKLVSDKTSGLPVFYDLDGQKVFSTIGFCQREDRSEFLQCAHSTAWYRFVHCLNELKSTDYGNDLYLPIEEVKETMLRIFELDHVKSALEKRKAVLLYEQGDETIDEMDQKLAQCLEHHSRYVGTLEIQKEMILESINSVIQCIQE
ncbi:hypothetical protein [Dyadobacter sp. LHD-138]|uniref:hypothetical protein n=1 Tax=Dyadobacter sp. LHD-138 TaxID=3071413 RepID=UPI0027E0533C|nr:hypothetical protein [Dyadobacter sp. LHD-138]MDQ6477212.1 hypothetical protein [Dyadobacter sp. LHD-138]